MNVAAGDVLAIAKAPVADPASEVCKNINNCQAVKLTPQYASGQLIGLTTGVSILEHRLWPYAPSPSAQGSSTTTVEPVPRTPTPTASQVLTTNCPTGTLPYNITYGRGGSATQLGMVMDPTGQTQNGWITIYNPDKPSSVTDINLGCVPGTTTAASSGTDLGSGSTDGSTTTTP